MDDEARAQQQAAQLDALTQQLLDLYPDAVHEVFRFLLTRCGDVGLAEDLTSETFMEAVSAIERGLPSSITIGWLVVVARRRLIDHWRRREREDRHLRAVHAASEAAHDPWATQFDAGSVREALSGLAANHQAVLTLRYLDGLSVPEVAEYMGRTVHAVESLLQRARAALRVAYDRGDTDAH